MVGKTNKRFIITITLIILLSSIIFSTGTIAIYRTAQYAHRFWALEKIQIYNLIELNRETSLEDIEDLELELLQFKMKYQDNQNKLGIMLDEKIDLTIRDGRLIQ